MPFRYGIGILQSVLMHTTEKSWYGGTFCQLILKKARRRCQQTLFFATRPMTSSCSNILRNRSQTFLCREPSVYVGTKLCSNSDGNEPLSIYFQPLLSRRLHEESFPKFFGVKKRKQYVTESSVWLQVAWMRSDGFVKCWELDDG